MEKLINEQLLKKIANKYLSLVCLYPNGIYLNQSLNPTYQFYNKVELAYSLLPSPLKSIINNDFFYQDYPGWWKSLYRKRAYQKLKRKAVDLFLEAFYETLS